jgi:hypothetical protein
MSHSDNVGPGTEIRDIRSYFPDRALIVVALTAIGAAAALLCVGVAWPGHFENSIASYFLAVMVSISLAVFFFVVFPFVPVMKSPAWTLGVQVAGPFVLWLIALNVLLLRQPVLEEY